MAIVSPSLRSTEEIAAPDDRALARWVRVTLVVVTACLLAVFVVAWWLYPYAADGKPLTMETHRQLGLPPCTFYLLTGYPCPSCGLTTSFSLLVRGDLINSLRANAVGTLLALLSLGLIPWALICACKGHYYFITSGERALQRLVLVFLALLLGRWFFVAGWAICVRYLL
jgi:hypothetical protein